MSEVTADKYTKELAGVRSSQHLAAWLLALLLLILIVLGVWQLVQFNDQAVKMEQISSRITGIEARLNQAKQRSPAAPDVPKTASTTD